MTMGAARKTKKVCLAMMVKNEERTLLKSLDSCTAVVQSIKIYDTGSTDSTLDIVRKYALDHPDIDVEIIQGEFVNFAVSRNVLLDAVDADDAVEYVLLLDANDELRGHTEFLKLIAQEDERDASQVPYPAGYLLRQHWHVGVGGGGSTYYNIRMVRARYGWRYKSPVHEYISSPREGEICTIRIDDPTIVLFQDRTYDCESTYARFSRDKDILLAEHLAHPEDARTCYYLAQTYSSLNMNEEAYKYYELRLSLGGYQEEIYQAYKKLGDLAHNMGMDPHVAIGWWMRALEHSKRVEPCICIASHYLFKDVKYHMALMFTSLAVSMEYPVHCNLFINKIDYDYTRYHLDGIAQYWASTCDKQGLDSCNKAVAYHENILDSLKADARDMTRKFVTATAYDHTRAQICISLAQKGHVAYITQLCSDLDLDLEAGDIDQDYVLDAEAGRVEHIMRRADVRLRESEGDEDAQHTIRASADRAINAAICNLRTALHLNQHQRELLVDISKISARQKYVESRIALDKNNIKCYMDRRAKAAVDSAAKSMSTSTKAGKRLHRRR